MKIMGILKLFLQLLFISGLLFFYQNCSEGFVSLNGEIQLNAVPSAPDRPEDFPYTIVAEDQEPQKQLFANEYSEAFQNQLEIISDPEIGPSFQVTGALDIISFGRVAIDTTKIYRISGDFKSFGVEPSQIYFGLAPYDEDVEFINHWDVHRRGLPAKIAGIINNGDGTSTLETVETLEGFAPSDNLSHQRILGFYFDGNITKKPDYIHLGIQDSSTLPGSGAYSDLQANSLLINGELPQNVLDALLQNPNAVIMNHYSGATYIYSAAQLLTLEPNEWQSLSGLVTDEAFNSGPRQFRFGTKWAKLVILANFGQDISSRLLFNNLKIEEVPIEELELQVVAPLQDLVVPQGQNVNLETVIDGPVESYEWFKDGVLIPGESSASLILPNAQAVQSGSYMLRASSFTTTVETMANVTIVAPPTVVTAVGDQIVPELNNITLAVQATGLNLTYKWFKDNVEIAGQTTAQLPINVATHLDQATYRVEIANFGGSASSQGQLTVALLTDGTQIYNRDCASCHSPLNQSTKFNRSMAQIKTAMMNVGAMSNVFLVGNEVGRADAQIQAVADALQVLPPLINTQPQGSSVFVGDAVSFSVSASGKFLSYQWIKDGANIAGATDTSYAITSAQEADAGSYSVAVTNSGGTIISNSAVLVVAPVPAPTPTPTPTPTPPPVGSADFWVSQANGSDSNSCNEARNESTPKKTISAGISCLSAGDILVVKAGSYNERLDATPSGTSWANATTVRAKPGDNVVLNRSGGNFARCATFSNKRYIIVDGFTCGAAGDDLYDGFKLESDSQYIRLQNMEIFGARSIGILDASGNTFGEGGNHEFLNNKIHDNGSSKLAHGMYITSANNKVWNNDFYRNGGYGLQVYSSNGPVNSNNIQYNRMWDQQFRLGIVIRGDNNLVANNIIWDNPFGGINSLGGSGNRYYNNTLYSNNGPGIDINSGCSNTIVKNNIVYANQGTISNSGSGSIISSNYTNNPLFINASQDNYKLQSGSGAINAGETILEVTDDYDKKSRPSGAYDIGAYEF